MEKKAKERGLRKNQPYRHLDCEPPSLSHPVCDICYGNPSTLIQVPIFILFPHFYKLACVRPFLGYLLQMPLVLNFGPSLEDLRPQETFYSKLTLEGLDEDGRTDAVIYSAYALSPPDFRVAAPCTIARVLHQYCAKGFL